MRVFVEAVPDILRAHEKLNLVDLVFGKIAFLLKFPDLLNALFLVGGDFQLILVAPEHSRGSSDASFAEEHVKIHDLIEATITHNQEKAAMVGLRAVLDQNADAVVNFLLHRRLCRLRL